MIKKLKSLPLYVKILIGMFLGVAIGLVAVQLDQARLITDWIKPFGDIFMRLLKLVAIPLVIVSLLKGVGNLSNISSLSKIGIRTILIYIGTTLLAIFVGLTLVELIAPGKLVSAESAAQMQSAYHSVAAANQEKASQMQEVPPLQYIVDIVPDNVLKAMSDNGNMLQIIFISILIGVATLMVTKSQSEAMMGLVESINHIILKIIDIIMMAAPVGVMALMAGMVADSAGNINLLGALGVYALTVTLGLLIMTFIVYPILVHSFTKTSIRKFFKVMSPVQLLAFTTSSSAATLPLNMESVEHKLGVSGRTTSFVLPVGVTINMDGTSCYQAVAAVFIAQVLGINLGWSEILTIVATTTISSIGTPGIPGGSVVILVMVLSSVGIPAEGLALILGLDRPLDMLRTVVNVTGDATVALIVDNSIDNDQKKESI